MILLKRQIYSKYLYETIQSTIYEDDRLSTLTTFSRENLYYVFLEEKGYYIWNIAEKWKKMKIIIFG